jgi:activator of 2-hydroxyglutaryl-CoA dehydratase
MAKPVMMTGGVAKNIGAVRALESKLETAIRVSSYAQVNGALGAAVLAGKLL